MPDVVAQKAAEAMRERCAKLVKDWLDGSGFSAEQKHAAKIILQGIRALEPDHD